MKSLILILVVFLISSATACGAVELHHQVAPDMPVQDEIMVTSWPSPYEKTPHSAGDPGFVSPYTMPTSNQIIMDGNFCEITTYEVKTDSLLELILNIPNVIIEQIKGFD